MNRLLLFLAVICLSFIPVRAQEMIKPEPNVAERVRLLESELERQNTKLDQLQKTLEEQQLTIKALLEKLSTQTNPITVSLVIIAGFTLDVIGATTVAPYRLFHSGLAFS